MRRAEATDVAPPGASAPTGAAGAAGGTEEVAFRGTTVVSSGGGGPAPPPKLDLRFADEEDAQDIASVVNAAFALEVRRPDNSLNLETTPPPHAATAFRATARLADMPALVAELEQSRRGGSEAVRWIVLETPCPEEKVVAAVAVSIIEDAGLRRGKMGRLLCLSVDPASQGGGVGTQLLLRSEAFCRSQGCRSVGIDMAMKREELQPWFKK